MLPPHIGRLYYGLSLPPYADELAQRGIRCNRHVTAIHRGAAGRGTHLSRPAQPADSAQVVLRSRGSTSHAQPSDLSSSGAAEQGTHPPLTPSLLISAQVVLRARLPIGRLGLGLGLGSGSGLGLGLGLGFGLGGRVSQRSPPPPDEIPEPPLYADEQPNVKLEPPPPAKPPPYGPPPEEPPPPYGSPLPPYADDAAPWQVPAAG